LSPSRSAFRPGPKSSLSRRGFSPKRRECSFTAIEEAQIKRLICVTGFGAGDSRGFICCWDASMTTSRADANAAAAGLRGLIPQRCFSMPRSSTSSSTVVRCTIFGVGFGRPSLLHRICGTRPSAMGRSADCSHAAGHAPLASIPHGPQAPGVLVPGASAVRGNQVTGTYRQGDGVPRPSLDILLH
jgi:hypothetical protein